MRAIEELLYHALDRRFQIDRIRCRCSRVAASFEPVRMVVYFERQVRLLRLQLSAWLAYAQKWGMGARCGWLFALVLLVVTMSLYLYSS